MVQCVGFIWNGNGIGAGVAHACTAMGTIPGTSAYDPTIAVLPHVPTRIDMQAPSIMLSSPRSLL
jgi:hypothetical protein